jgi:hypothetical protein
MESAVSTLGQKRTFAAAANRGDGHRQPRFRQLGECALTPCFARTLGFLSPGDAAENLNQVFANSDSKAIQARLKCV